jgi:hypothetical protein
MSYTVNNFNGSFLTTINDGQTDTTSTPLRLIGRGVATYGEAIAENFVHMLENFARTTPPSNPLIGQFWYHIDANGSGNHIMKVCKSVNPISWAILSGVVSSQGGGLNLSSGFPASPHDGDIFWDGHQLWVWDDTDSVWTLIGPMSTPTQNTQMLFDGNLVSDGTHFYNVIKVVINGKIVAIYSDSLTSFIPSPAINDGKGNTNSFPRITGGLNLHSDYASTALYAPLAASSQPTVNNSFDFGSSTNKWKTIYCNTLSATNLTVNGTTFDISNVMHNNTSNNPTTSGLNFGTATTPFGTLYTKNVILTDDPQTTNVGDALLTIPSGTTAQRPTTAGIGTIRFNTTTSVFEGKNSSAWVSLLDSSTASTTYLPKSGGTMTGLLTLASNPVGNLDAAPKQYVDTFYPKTGGVITGAVTVNGAVSISGATTLTQINETKVIPTISSGAITLNLANGTMFAVTLTSNITTITFTNVPTAGNVASISLFLTQDATGSRSVSWPASVKFAGTAPTLSSTASKTDILTLVSHDGGVTWFGMLAGKGF